MRDDEEKATSANTHWSPKYPANWRFLFLTRNSKCTNEAKDPSRWIFFHPEVKGDNAQENLASLYCTILF